jgi:eukaryotic-like serine/threonine-protein kinase
VIESRIVGNYRLGERIGEGGMGEVYLAERDHEFRKRVAIKLIRPGMNSLEIVRRFVIERQTLAALNHPQIVRLIDGGTTADGLPYLVVDYVEGQHIDRYCESHKLSVTDRLNLFISVCGAVHHAHQSLIVHCDLKPSNILVTPEGVPMLLDFGIAKLLDPVSMGISENVAKTRQRAFTPDHASPEQLRGDPVTTATDIYALGVILYELLTGHSPNRVDASAAIAEWIKSVCEDDAEAPSTVIRRVRRIQVDDSPPQNITPESVSQTREGDPERLERRLRGDLDAIVLKALRKDPKDRYGSADQMAEDIRRHLTGRPVLARKNTGAYIARKFLQRHKYAVAAAALVLLAIAGGIASTLYQARISARRFEEVRHLAHTFLYDVHDSILNLPGATAARTLIARTGTEYLDRLSQDARGDTALELELADGYLKLGDVEGNPMDANRGDTSKAVANYQKALPLAEAAAARDPKNIHAKQILGRAHMELGNVLPFVGKAPEALDHAKKAEQFFREVWAAQPSNVEARLDLARAYDTEGNVQGGVRGLNLGHTAEALAAYRQSAEMIPDVPPTDPLASRVAISRVVGMIRVADMQSDAGHLAEALNKYQVALQTVEDLTNKLPNNTRILDMGSVVLNKIATVHSALRENEPAAQAYHRAIEFDEQILRADPNNNKARAGIIACEKNLGDLNFYNTADFVEALRAYRHAAQALEIRVHDDPGNMMARQNLSEIITCVASCLLRTGQPAQARVEALRGLAMAKEVADLPGATHEQIYNYAYLGITIEPDDLQNPDAVLPYALKAVEQTHSSNVYSLHVLAQTYAGKDDYVHAVETEERALALFPPVEPGKPVPNVEQAVQHLLEMCRAELKKRGG